MGTPCPGCGGQLHSLRKPYESRGRALRYVALVCPTCPASFTLADLGLKVSEQVRRPAGRSPHVAIPRGSQPGEEERARLLRFWRSVELFAAPKLDRPDPRERRYAVRPGDRLPWEDGHPLRRQQLPEHLVWRHTVYGGVFGRDKVHAVLERVFGSSGIDVNERVPRGESALFAGLVTDDGRLLLDSLVLSTAAWATGRAHRPGPRDPGWLDGFDNAAALHAGQVRERTAASDEDTEAAALAEAGVKVSRGQVTYELLTELVVMTAEQLGVAELLEPAGLRVHSERVSRKREHDTQTDFLNSFFIDDLKRVSGAVATGACGPALATYLTSDDDHGDVRRFDVRDPATFDQLIDKELAPSRMPVGRWPAAAAHPLATSQQLAINAIFHRLGQSGGVFAVNGPPGTGKTTMLRDLIAAVIVPRASRLAALTSPTAAFATRTVGWSTDRVRHNIRPPHADLTGFEIVVASANNTAVANVTQEIPQLKAIDEAWVEHANYLAEHASRILAAPAWGLVAAVLGNKTNRGEFVNRFWYGQTADKAKKPGEEGPGFLDWLRQAESTASTTDWTSAVAVFRAALAEEQRLRDARQAAHEALRRLPEAEQNRATVAGTVHAATTHRDRTKAAARIASDRATGALHLVDQARRQRVEHRAIKPGFLEILFTLGRAIRRWHTEDEQLQTAIVAAEHSAAVATAAAARARDDATRAGERLAAATDALAEADRILVETRASVAAAQRQWAGHLPDAAWRADEQHREPAGPWLDEPWNAARTKVLLAALNLHTAFLAGAAPIMRTNLHAAIDVLKGRAPADAPEAAIRAAWQSLFLVVPVISTTFASVARLLGPLGPEAIGWLLVDEAGQAAPQQAVGAIWRAKRVVAVGDPLQLEPVTTVLHTTQQALRRHHGVPDSDIWLPGRSSVQALADRITPIGTRLPGPNDIDVWVGAPLRVHRRCDNPMFDIVNTSVYGGLMIHVPPGRTSPLTVVESAWIDVTATSAEGNWIPDETDAAEEILGYLLRSGVNPADMLVISPFRDTANVLVRQFARRHPELRCGTVHIAQGKEADVVVLVLGGNPARPGARAWVAEGPNMFNVAVSRAKQRLYVVGDHDSWANLRYFSTLARTLPARPLKPRAVAH